jgi:hypothetical protein
LRSVSVVALTRTGAPGFAAIDGELMEGLKASGADELFFAADFCSGLCSPAVLSAVPLSAGFLSAAFSKGFFSEALFSGALRS